MASIKKKRLFLVRVIDKMEPDDDTYPIFCNDRPTTEEVVDFLVKKFDFDLTDFGRALFGGLQIIEHRESSLTVRRPKKKEFRNGILTDSDSHDSNAIRIPANYPDEIVLSEVLDHMCIDEADWWRYKFEKAESQDRAHEIWTIVAEDVLNAKREEIGYITF